MGLDLFSGWELQGSLEDGLSMPCQAGNQFDLGEMWECPFFTQLHDVATNKPSSTWILCVSPYPHKVQEIISKQPTNPVLYWLGQYQAGKFGMKDGPGMSLLSRRPLGQTKYQCLYSPAAP